MTDSRLTQSRSESAARLRTSSSSRTGMALASTHFSQRTSFNCERVRCPGQSGRERTLVRSSVENADCVGHRSPARVRNRSGMSPPIQSSGAFERGCI